MITRRTMLGTIPAAGAALALAGTAASSATASSAGASSTSGMMQSPIDIRARALRPGRGLPPLRVEYGVTDLAFGYRSRDADCLARGPEDTVEAEVPAGVASAFVGDTEYELEQFHFHTPSEHTLGGRPLPVEQHFVHRSAAGEVLAVAVFLLPGHGRREVDRVLADLPEECGETIELPEVDLRSLLPRRLDVYRYEGSVTTSPYSEGVRWNVLVRPGLASLDSIRRLEHLFPAGNARETQPLAGREVRLVRGRS